MKEIKESDVFDELNESVKVLENEGAPYDKYLILSLIGAIGFAQSLNLISGELSENLSKRARRMLRHCVDKSFAAKVLDELVKDVEKSDSYDRNLAMQGAVGAVSYAVYIKAISSFDGAVYLKRLHDLQLNS